MVVFGPNIELLEGFLHVSVWVVLTVDPLGTFSVADFTDTWQSEDLTCFYLWTVCLCFNLSVFLGFLSEKVFFLFVCLFLSSAPWHCPCPLTSSSSFLCPPSSPTQQFQGGSQNSPELESPCISPKPCSNLLLFLSLKHNEKNQPHVCTYLCSSETVQLCSLNSTSIYRAFQCKVYYHDYLQYPKMAKHCNSSKRKKEKLWLLQGRRNCPWALSFAPIFCAAMVLVCLLGCFTPSRITPTSNTDTCTKQQWQLHHVIPETPPASLTWVWTLTVFTAQATDFSEFSLLPAERNAVYMQHAEPSSLRLCSSVPSSVQSLRRSSGNIFFLLVQSQ